jgi:hypothetical protein
VEAALARHRVPAYANTMNWGAASVVIGILMACGAVFGYISKRLRARKIISYELLVSVPFLRNLPEIKSAGLSVIHHGEKLANPHLLQVRLTSKSQRDIPTSAFDQRRPLCIDVGAPIVALLEARYNPDQAPLPKVTTAGTTLQIQPCKIRHRQDMTFSVLADGPSAHLKCASNPILNYDLKPGKTYQTRPSRNMHIRSILGWASVIFLVFYLVADPTGAAHAMTNLGNALRGVGESLATFFTSLF